MWRGEVGSASSPNPPFKQYLIVIRGYLVFNSSTGHIIKLYDPGTSPVNPDFYHGFQRRARCGF
jgi:hypothetical protein